jgi:hypothetical protein
MKFEFNEKLPNLKETGTISRIYFGLDYDVKGDDGNFEVKGKFLILRELRTSYNGKTEIKNEFPIDITFPEKNIKKGDVTLNLNGVNFEFQDDCLVVFGELEIPNLLEEPSENLVFIE